MTSEIPLQIFSSSPWRLSPSSASAAAELADENSVFHYYKKLISLRKEHPIIVYGKYEPMLEDNEELFVYTREMDGEKLLVVCSFCDHETHVTIPAEFTGASCLISNTGNAYDRTELTLKPYEAFVLRKSGGKIKHETETERITVKCRTPLRILQLSFYQNSSREQIL